MMMREDTSSGMTMILKTKVMLVILRMTVENFDGENYNQNMNLNEIQILNKIQIHKQTELAEKRKSPFKQNMGHAIHIIKYVSK